MGADNFSEDFVRGTQGRIVHGGSTVKFMSGWQMSVSVGIAEASGMGSSGPSRVYTKYRDYSGSFSGSYRLDQDSSDSTAQENIEAQFVKGGTAEPAVLKLQESSKSMYFGKVLITGVEKDTPANGIQSWTANWVQADGPMSHDSDTTT